MLALHCHTAYSNIRLLDCINPVDKLIDKAAEMGFTGVTITDHETIAAHMKAFKHGQKIKQQYPDFKVILGNEIYLTKDREKGQRYYHFLLLAKNKLGHRALRELSSNSWLQSYYDRGMERVPTTYDELEAIVKKYPGTLIATTACLGGELSAKTLQLTLCEMQGAKDEAARLHNEIVEHVLWLKGLFGDDFYIECAPSASEDQLLVNPRLRKIAEAFGVKMVVGCDSHYLRPEDRYVHEAYLNSKGGEREVASFYQYAYLQTEEEMRFHLSKSDMEQYYDEMKENSNEIYNKIEDYSILHQQVVPKVKVTEYPKSSWWGANDGHSNEMSNFPTLQSLFNSDDEVERQWVNECWQGLESLVGPWYDNLNYVKQLEIEADVLREVGHKIEDNMFSYFTTLKHYIDFFWDCGSIVGPGRGSATGFLSNYCLGITQVDPIENRLPWWRFLSKERPELPDVDVDLCPTKRPQILQAIKDERGKDFNDGVSELARENLGCTLVATFGQEKTKSAIATACRGYRSEDCPDGIDSDTALYLSSLVPSERGFLWTLSDVVFGNEEKDRKPVKQFIYETDQYPGLLDIMFGIENLINKRSSHASGVILFNEDPYELGAFMKTPSGDVITQYDLGDCEASGLVKFDFLLTEVSDKLVKCMELLEESGTIENDTLRNLYNKYLHPKVLDLNHRVWVALGDGSVMDCFQFSTDVGLIAAKDLKPKSIEEMTSANCLMRLMAQEKGGETPMAKYKRFKENFPALWEQEMAMYGVTEEERKLIAPVYEPAYGCPSMQEDMMVTLMAVAGFDLADANKARKIVAKKQMSEIPSLKEKIYKGVKRSRFADYIWDTCVKLQLG